MSGYGSETKYSAQQGFQGTANNLPPGGGETAPGSSYSSGGGVNDMLFNRYRLEMVKQLHGIHSTDSRSSFGVPPFSGHQV